MKKYIHVSFEDRLLDLENKMLEVFIEWRDRLKTITTGIRSSVFNKNKYPSNTFPDRTLQNCAVLIKDMVRFYHRYFYTHCDIQADVKIALIDLVATLSMIIVNDDDQENVADAKSMLDELNSPDGIISEFIHKREK